MQIVISNPVFGKNLRYLRRKYGLSRRSLAKLLGVSTGFLRKVESPFWPQTGIDFPAVPFSRLGKIFDVNINSMLHLPMWKRLEQK